MSVTKGQKTTQAHGKFLSVELDKKRFTILRTMFIIALIVSWVFLIINIINLLGETIIPGILGSDYAIIITQAVHFETVIWMVVVVVVVSVLNLMLRRPKK